MKVFTTYDPKVKNAGFKAKYDIEKILEETYPDCKSITITYDDSLKSQIVGKYYGIRKILRIMSNIRKGDTIVVQHPLTTQKKILKNAGRKICIIHDLDGLRAGSYEVSSAQIDFIKCFDKIISHNQSMTKVLVDSGIEKEKIVNLELFDYLCKSSKERKNTFNPKNLKVVYSGNLAEDKCPFIYQLDNLEFDFNVNLYGVGLDGKRIKNKKKIHEKGCFSPDSPEEIEGDLGLVWDGVVSGFEDENTTKNYNKYNNPHKLSCYIAAGIPVVVWRKAAIAKFVTDNKIGYLIDRIDEIDKLEFSDYDEKFKNVQKISKRVKEGYYTKRAMKKAMK